MHLPVTAKGYRSPIPARRPTPDPSKRSVLAHESLSDMICHKKKHSVCLAYTVLQHEDPRPGSIMLGLPWADCILCRGIYLMSEITRWIHAAPPINKGPFPVIMMPLRSALLHFFLLCLTSEDIYYHR